mgnify:CR=1 FL=1
MINSAVVWVTGMPGAGKTTFADALAKQLKVQGRQDIIRLDGDQLREVFANTDYSVCARLSLAMQYAKLANMLALQGYIVIVSTVSLFHKVHQWNRANLPNYVEVYLNPSMDVLHNRNQKGLYTDAGNNILGKDIAPEFPQNSDYEFNDEDIRSSVNLIIEQCFTA